MSQTIYFDLKAMREIDVRTVERGTLTDIRDVKVQTSLPDRERLLDFIRQVKNPYLYKYKNMIMQSSFGDTEDSIEDLVERHFLSL